MNQKGNPTTRASQGTFDQIDRNQRFDRPSLCDHAVSEIHYHIRWHPTGQLDWECFSTVEAAEARVKQIRLRGETSTIEQCETSRLRSHPQNAQAPRLRAAF